MLSIFQNEFFRNDFYGGFLRIYRTNKGLNKQYLRACPLYLDFFLNEKVISSFIAFLLILTPWNQLNANNIYTNPNYQNLVTHRIFSPIVEVKSPYFYGSGILFWGSKDFHFSKENDKFEEGPRILTSSHIILGEKSKPISIRLAIANNNFISAQHSLPIFESQVELEIDDPIADYSILKIKKGDPNFDLLSFWSQKSFEISETGDIKFTKNSQWRTTLNNGIIGVGETKILNQNDMKFYRKVIETPIIDGFKIDTLEDSDSIITGFVRNLVKVPTFAKPGMSGSIIFKDQNIYGLISKVMLDNTPLAYGITIREIADRLSKNPSWNINLDQSEYEEQNQVNPKGSWVLENNNFYLEIEYKNINLRQSLNSAPFISVGGDTGNGGGDPGNGSDLIPDKVKKNINDQKHGHNSSNTERIDLDFYYSEYEPPYWYLLKKQSTSFISNDSLVNLVNPFSRIFNYNPIEFRQNEKWNAIKYFSDPKVRDKNNIPITQKANLADIFLALQQNRDDDEELKYMNEFDMNSRNNKSKNEKPRYVRYALKLENGELCYPFSNFGNARTWDNTLSIQIEDQVNLKIAAINDFNQRLGIQQSHVLVDQFINHFLYKDLGNNMKRVGPFTFNEIPELFLLDVKTDLPSLDRERKECSQNFISNRELTPQTLPLQSGSSTHLSNAINSQLNSNVGMTYETGYTENRFSQNKKPDLKKIYQNFHLEISRQPNETLNFVNLSKENQSIVLNKIKTNNPMNDLYSDPTHQIRVLLLYDRNNLNHLERVFIDTPNLLIEFIYVELNSDHPR